MLPLFPPLQLGAAMAWLAAVGELGLTKAMVEVARHPLASDMEAVKDPAAKLTSDNPVPPLLQVML
jgi:hypothetical protein